MTILLMFVGIVFPIIIIVAIYSNYDQLKHPEVLSIFGSAYNNMKLRSENNPKLAPLPSD